MTGSKREKVKFHPPSIARSRGAPPCNTRNVGTGSRYILQLPKSLSLLKCQYFCPPIPCREEKSPRPELPDRMTVHEDENLFDLPDSLKDIIRGDDMQRFVPYMMEKFPCPQNGYGSLAAVEKDAQKPTYCPKAIVSFIFIHRAVNCATALLEGETGLTLDPNHPCLLGRYPLHDAASVMSYDLVDLLLCHGAQANVRTTEVKPYTRGGLLPLSVVVENFRLHRYLLTWTPKKSFFKLIIMFCLPQMKAPLEICKLLALSTTDVVEVFNGYCMDGKLFEIVALLMVAREKLIDNVSGRLLIRKHIEGEIEKLINEEIKLRRTFKSVRACKNRIMNLQNSLLVLEIFERAGDVIEKYVEFVHYHPSTTKEEVVEKVQSLLVGSGFLLTHEDTNLRDIDCKDGIIRLALHVLDTKLRISTEAISSNGGSQWESVAVKALHYKNRDWAMRGFFAKIPVLWHGQDMSRRNLLLRRPEHSAGSLPFLRARYFSVACAGRKGLRYL